MKLSYFIQVLIIGIANGFLYYLIACGLSLIVSGIGIVNVAQGCFFILGIFLSLSLTPRIGLGWSCLLVPVIISLFAIPFERLIRPLLSKHVFYVLLATYALAMIIGDVTYFFVGGNHGLTAVPAILSGKVKILGAKVPVYYLFICVVGLLIYIAYWLMMNKTKLGKILRANMTDRQMVEALGYNVNFLFVAMLMLAFAMSALGGVLSGCIQSYDAKGSVTVFTNVMPIIFIGGLRNMKGTLPSALLIGVVGGFAAVLTPQFYNMVPAAMMVLVMLFKPEGLFTRKEKA